MSEFFFDAPVQTLPKGHPSFPPGLERLADCEILRIGGELSNSGPRVGVVGTRHADPEALDFARAIARDLAEAGAVIISGGARGVDTAAHRGALDAEGRTLAVLATGFVKPYPKENAALFRRVVEAGGALLTEAPDDAVPAGFRFLHRNRIIAALSDALVVVQAPRPSGTLSTASHAKRLGVPVFVVPGPPWEPRFEGALDLLREGSRICTSAPDVLSVIAPEVVDSTRERPSPEKNHNDFSLLGNEARRLLDALSSRPRRVAEVAKAASLPIHEALRGLTELQLAGRVEARDGGRYALVPPRRRLK